MLNNQKGPLEAQQHYLLPLSKKVRSQKNQSLQLSKFKLNITKKFKEDFIQSISNVQSKGKITKYFNADHELQRYKKRSQVFQKKGMSGNVTLNSSYESYQQQKHILKSISHLKLIRKKALQKAIMETEEYYRKLSPQRSFIDDFGSLQKSGVHKRRRGNINLMLKKCERQKEISKFQNDLIFTKHPQSLLPIRFLTEPMHPRQTLKTFILKPQKHIKQEESPIASPIKINRESQEEMKHTLQNFKFIHCINIEKAKNLKLLKNSKNPKPNRSEEGGTQLIIRELKKCVLKQKLKRSIQGNTQLKDYHRTQLISPWIEEYQLSPKYSKPK